jgi:hypothetical protein
MSQSPAGDVAEGGSGGERRIAAGWIVRTEASAKNGSRLQARSSFKQEVSFIETEQI